MAAMQNKQHVTAILVFCKGVFLHACSLVFWASIKRYSVKRHSVPYARPILTYSGRNFGKRQINIYAALAHSHTDIPLVSSAAHRFNKKN